MVMRTTMGHGTPWAERPLLWQLSSRIGVWHLALKLETMRHVLVLGLVRVMTRTRPTTSTLQVSLQVAGDAARRAVVGIGLAAARRQDRTQATLQDMLQGWEG